jgi:hypothetical protein
LEVPTRVMRGEVGRFTPLIGANDVNTLEGAIKDCLRKISSPTPPFPTWTPRLSIARSGWTRPDRTGLFLCQVFE